MRKISARGLWIRILTARIETGEPYLIFSDHVTTRRCRQHHKLSGLDVKLSNLCSEITLPTGRRPARRRPHRGLLPVFVEPRDLVRVEGQPALHPRCDAFPRQCAAGLHRPRAGRDVEGEVFSAMRERSVGLGVMGFHCFLQSMNVPCESVDREGRGTSGCSSTSANKPILPPRPGRGARPLPRRRRIGFNERFSHKMSIAPTASI